MKYKDWISRALLAFVLITVGFAIGRETAPGPGESAVPAPEAAAGDNAPAERVVVYATHMTFRCWECNQIEWLAQELLEKEFAEELASGRIEFRSVDYLRDSRFARRYDLSASTLVVARFRNGEEAGFERLDEVWTKSRDREQFMAYVRKAVEDALSPEGAE